MNKLVFALLFAGLVASASAISCYSCVNCGSDLGTKISSLPILGDCQLCTKTVVGGVIARTCSPTTAGLTAGCSGNDDDNRVCYCNTDDCNGAGTAIASLATMVVGLLASKLF